MSGMIDNSITIYEAMNNIRNGKYVMPAFQRQYVWDMNRIEKLWDSILLDYPIATFLFWHIDDTNITRDTFMCHFLQSITFNSTRQADSVNYEINSVNLDYTDTAILDGQQRLTSLYVSLFGTTNMRGNYVRRNSRETKETKLIIELNKNKLPDDEVINSKKHNIKFCDKVFNLSPTQFEIRKIIDKGFEDKARRQSSIERSIASVPENSKVYARQILNKLCEKVYDETIIRYTEIRDMKHDDALEMFVRFNSGGRALRRSEITMSILEAHWPEARTVLGSLLSDTYKDFGNEFLIRAALMIYGDVVKSTINVQIARELRDNIVRFEKALKKLDELLKEMHIRIDRFKTCWNILLPVIYTIYYNQNYRENIEGIFTYLVRAILLIYFRSGTTGRLHQMKSYINENNFSITIEMLNQITELKVTEGKIDDILNSEKDSRVAGEALYYISLDWIDDNVQYDIDHMHPYSRFETRPIGVNEVEYYKWRQNRNRLPNLSYLPSIINQQKNDKALDYYVSTLPREEKEKYIKQALVPVDTSLNICSFGDFYENRKELLRKELKTLLRWDE